MLVECPIFVRVIVGNGLVCPFRYESQLSKGYRLVSIQGYQFFNLLYWNVMGQARGESSAIVKVPGDVWPTRAYFLGLLV